MGSLNNPAIGRSLQLYHRETWVEAQLAELRALPSDVLVARLEKDACGNYANETLVSVTRALVLAGVPDEARRVLRILADRVRGRTARHLDVWRIHGREAREDAAQEILRMMLECVLSVQPDQEFWECRFWTCFDRRARSLLRDLHLRDGATLSLDALSQSSPGILRDPADSPPARAEAAEALRHLPEPARTAFYLRFYCGYREESGDAGEATIATILGVSGRSVRNYLRRAGRLLKDWRDDDAE